MLLETSDARTRIADVPSGSAGVVNEEASVRSSNAPSEALAACHVRPSSREYSTLLMLLPRSCAAPVKLSTLWFVGLGEFDVRERLGGSVSAMPDSAMNWWMSPAADLTP